MAKFVKLENGNYINVDMIVEIDKETEKCSQVYMRERLAKFVTQVDVENILKASEEYE